MLVLVTRDFMQSRPISRFYDNDAPSRAKDNKATACRGTGKLDRPRQTAGKDGLDCRLGVRCHLALLWLPPVLQEVSDLLCV